MVNATFIFGLSAKDLEGAGPQHSPANYAATANLDVIPHVDDTVSVFSPTLKCHVLLTVKSVHHVLKDDKQSVTIQSRFNRKS